MTEILLAKLRHHPFVAEFEPRHVEKLATLATEKSDSTRDQILFREGDDWSEFYLIVTGLVALEIAAPGHTFRVQTLFAGDELGWSAMLMGTGKQFQARTLERVDALAFEGDGAAGRMPRGHAVRLHPDAAAAGRRVRAAAGDAPAAAGYVLAGGGAGRRVNRVRLFPLLRVRAPRSAPVRRRRTGCPAGTEVGIHVVAQSLACGMDPA